MPDVALCPSRKVGSQDAQANQSGIRVVQAVGVQGGDDGVRGLLEHSRQRDQCAQGEGCFIRVVLSQARQQEAESAEQGDGADGVLDVSEREGHAFVCRSSGAELGGSRDLDVIQLQSAVTGRAQGVEAVRVVEF